MQTKTVILDPGHGGINPTTGEYVTSGKRSPIWEDGSVYYEGVGNRLIMELAAKMLVAKGVKVLYTVPPSEWRDVKLSERIRVANRHHMQNRDSFLISIHSNGHDKPNAKGYEVFTSKGETKSDKIATIWYNEHQAQFPSLSGRKDMSDGDVDKEDSLAMTRETNCPAILIETMFHTNREECKILMSAEGKRKCAQAIVNTVMKYNG